MFLVLFFSIILTLVFTIIYNLFFTNKNKSKYIKMFKNVGTSGITQTEVNLLFGIISFKNDLGEENNATCYSYQEKIKKGERILITDYDSDKEMYVVDFYPYVK